jgi:hypothetical protein
MKDKVLMCWDSVVQRHLYNITQQGASNAGTPVQVADIFSKKIVGKNLPNVRHLPMQETFQRAG